MHSSPRAAVASPGHHHSLHVDCSCFASQPYQHCCTIWIVCRDESLKCGACSGSISQTSTPYPAVLAGTLVQLTKAATPVWEWRAYGARSLGALLHRSCAQAGSSLLRPTEASCHKYAASGLLTTYLYGTLPVDSRVCKTLSCRVLGRSCGAGRGDAAPRQIRKRWRSLQSALPDDQ